MAGTLDVRANRYRDRGAVAGCTATSARCRFWTWGEDYVRPPCCTDHLVELALFTHELFSRHGIFHWLDYGSLLGAVRGGELIPWDSDADFGFLASDVGRLLALEPEIAAAGHHLDTSDPHVFRIEFSPVNTQHVDLFAWVKGDGVVSRPNPDADWPGMQGRDAFPSRFIDQLGTVTFYNHDMPAPSPVHEFLENHRYGPGYMTPRRAVTDIYYLPPIAPEDMTSSVVLVVEELGRALRKETALLERSRLYRSSFGRRWVSTGRPLAPPPQLYRQLMGSLVDASERERPLLVDLVGRLASTLGFIDEFEHPSITTRARCMVRRATRTVRKVPRVWARGAGTGEVTLGA